MSLMELLVVLGVIGIITAIAVPKLTGSMMGSMNDTRDRHHARNLEQVYQAARTAGVDFLVPNNLRATIDQIVGGGVSGTGALAGTSYAIPGLSDEEKGGAMRYLELQGPFLVYRTR
jgi:Tfp pilus assembly protein FimT